MNVKVGTHLLQAVLVLINIRIHIIVISRAFLAGRRQRSKDIRRIRHVDVQVKVHRYSWVWQTSVK